jgi:hypothetical protein
MTIDLAGMWESGLLLFYLSIALVMVMDAAVIVAAGSQQRPEPMDAVSGAEPLLTGT